MKTKIINIVILILLMTGTLYFLLRDQEMDTLMHCIVSANKGWLFTGILFMTGFICIESVVIHYLMNSLKYSISIFHCIKYSFIGFFVSAITPSSTGGQPAQVYFMKLDGISVSVSSLVLMVVTITYKVALLGIAFICLVFNSDFVLTHVSGIEFIVLFGIIINVLMIVILMMAVFKQSLAKRMCAGIICFLGSKKIIKRPDDKLRKLIRSIEKYDKGAEFLRSHRTVILNVMLITVVQRLLYFMVTYSVYRAFGLNECGILEIITLQLIITMAVDNLPWPGGMGVNEGIFMIFFSEIFTETFVTAGLMLTRGLNYYYIILAGGIVTAFARFMKRKQIHNIDNISGD